MVTIKTSKIGRYKTRNVDKNMDGLEPIGYTEIADRCPRLCPGKGTP